MTSHRLPVSIASLPDLWLEPWLKMTPLTPEGLEHERRVTGPIAGRVIEAAQMSRDGRTVRYRLAPRTEGT